MSAVAGEETMIEGERENVNANTARVDDLPA